MPSIIRSSTAFTEKGAEDDEPAAIVTLGWTVASVVSLLLRLTVTAEVVGPVRVTVPVAAPGPAPSEKLPGVTETVRVGTIGL